MLRERIVEQYGKECRIQQVRRTPRFRSALFVVDLMQGARLTRILGALGKSGQLTEQSGMDMLRPERLVFLYERLMLIARCLGPDWSAVMNGRLMSAWAWKDRSFFAFSAASFNR